MEKTAAIATRMTQAASAITSGLVNRIKWMTRLGLSFGGKRDAYKTFGYTRNLTYLDYLTRYTRDSVAKRVVNAYPEATWRSQPVVFDQDKDKLDSPFEKAWIKLVKDFSLYTIFERLDKLAGIGDYAILVVGAPGDPTTAIGTKLSALFYLAPKGQGAATIVAYENDPAKPLYGQPKTYRVGMQTDAPNATANIKAVAPSLIDSSRVIHVAEGLLEGQLFGTPRLEAVWNDIDDLRKVVSGSAEMFYIAGNRGLHVRVDPDVIIQDPTNLKDEVDEYVNEISRVITTQGVEVESLGSDVADPRGNAMVCLQMISAGTGIPLRILTGSEAGQLASTQDRDNWNERIVERRTSFALPMILIPFVKMMIAIGVLPKPEGDGEQYDWPDLMAYSADQRSVQALREGNAIAQYANGVKNGGPLVPPEFLAKRWFNVDLDDYPDFHPNPAQDVQETAADNAPAMGDAAVASAEAAAENAQNPPEVAPGTSAGAGATIKGKTKAKKAKK